MIGKVWFRLPGEESVYLSGQTAVLHTAPREAGFLFMPFDRDMPGVWINDEKTEAQAAPGRYNIPEANQDYLESDYYNRESYMAWVEDAREAIRSGMLEKVVTARSLFRALPPRPDVWYPAACQAYPDAAVCLIDAPRSGLWLGASPEPLLHWKDGEGFTVALAGTRRSDGEAFSAKEREEQAYIGRFIEEVFQARGIAFERGPAEEIAQGSLRHIRTRYGFRCAYEQVWELVRSLHPTPAVGGYPRVAALQLLQRERTARSYYAGYFGRWTPDEISLWVNLRCGRMYRNGILQYAGTGITADSDPAAEWLETEMKLGVLGKILL
ncbi:MAG: chorismate-binding protein [Bacteroidota bacterium]